MAKILISIDHKWRDLPGYVYIKKLLEQRGHKIYFVRNGLERYFATAIKPEMLIAIHIYEESKQKLVKELSEQGCLIVLMPTEGIPTLEGYRTFASGAGIDHTYIDLYFVWNEPMRDILLEHRAIASEKIMITGVPRFDFYRPPLNSLLMKRNDFIKKYNLVSEYPIITFATNFTQASFCKKNTEFYNDDARNLGFGKAFDELYGDYRKIPEMDYISREINIKAFINLVQDFHHINFVLKLHPSEDHTFYYNLIESELKDNRNRVAIIVQEYIWDVLNNTDIELKRSCTTGIESWLLGIPTIEMKLNPDEWYFSKEHASGSDIATSYNELKGYIEAYLAGEKIYDNQINRRQRFLDKWCFMVDGQSSARMVGKINKLLITEKKIKKYRFSLYNFLVFCSLTFTDYLILDFKIFGIINSFKKNRIDKLGRMDKHFRNRDVGYWEKKLSKIIKC